MFCKIVLELHSNFYNGKLGEKSLGGDSRSRKVMKIRLFLSDSFFVVVTQLIRAKPQKRKIEISHCKENMSYADAHFENLI